MLGTYFEGDFKSIKVSVFSGKVKLNDLRLRPSAADALGIPLTIKQGSVRHVELELSLQNLRGTPARMLVEGVDVCVDPNHDPGRTDSAATARAQAARQQRLHRDRDERRNALLSPPKDGAQASLMARLVTGFINNLIIHLTDVHIRVEAPSSAFGVRLKTFSLTTTDINWCPAIAQADATELFKQMEVCQLSVYSQTQPASGKDEIAVVAPVDLICRARLMLAVPVAFDRPILSVAINIGAVKVSLYIIVGAKRRAAAPGCALYGVASI